MRAESAAAAMAPCASAELAELAAEAPALALPELDLLLPAQGARWADVADSDGDDDEDEFDELQVASGHRPQKAAAGPRTSAPSRGNLAGEAGGPCTARPRSVSDLSACAAMFFPTVSHEITGIYFSSVREAPRPELERERAQTDTATASGRHKKPRRPQRSKAASDSKVVQEMGVMPEASEEVWQHRAAMRNKELGVYRDRLLRLMPLKDGRDAEEQRKLVQGLPAPDPEDRAVSRRAWRKAIDNWLKANLVKWCPEEGQGSVLSTEEWQSLATESLATASTRCDDGESESSD